MRGYDSHLLMQAILEGGISCIPNNTEKYISFPLGQLRFNDSVQFLLTSLDKLVAANPPEAFRITAQYEPDRERQGLLMRKGVYPYEYMDAWERFAEPKLPPKEAFYSKLSDAHISNGDYAHAQKVWETFGCETLGDYSDLYCCTDVLLLTDVFKRFRRTCQEQYGLDPDQYYTSPGLSWDTLLKKTGVKLELLTDYNQHLFIEKGMRGGISLASKRHARANNPMVEGYDPGRPSSHILYLDANNLYGWAMSQYLPTSGFWWVDDCRQLAKTIAEHPADSPEGYILLTIQSATTAGSRLIHSVDLWPEGRRISWAYWCPKSRSARIRFQRSTIPWSRWMSTRHGRNLENLFFASSPEPKGQLTQNLLGSIRVTCRSKIAKIVPIGNPRWPPWPPSWKSIFRFFSWTERPIDSKLARKHQGDL